MEQPVLIILRFSDGREFGPASKDVIVQWAREGRVPVDGILVDAASGLTSPVMEDATLSVLLQAPPTVACIAPVPEKSGLPMIPYRNPAALVGYYMGVFCLAPGFCYLLCVPAIVLGVIGLRNRTRNPQIRGTAHAVVAITLGVLGPLIWSALFFMSARVL